MQVKLERKTAVKRVDELTPCFCKKRDGLGKRFVTIKDGHLSVLAKEKRIGSIKKKIVEKINRELR